MQIAGEHCHTQSNPSGLYFAYIELAMTSGWHGMQAVINTGHGNELMFLFQTGYVWPCMCLQ